MYMYIEGLTVSVSLVEGSVLEAAAASVALLEAAAVSVSLLEGVAASVSLLYKALFYTASVSLSMLTYADVARVVHAGEDRGTTAV
jgi:hypothetical protein